MISDEEFKELKDQMEFLKFRQDLLFTNDGISRLLYEYEIKKAEYDEIMNLMDTYRDKIDNGEEVNHGSFERSIYQIVPKHDGDYHMCEYLAREFMEAGRWEEVFPMLYGDMPKYQGLKLCNDISTPKLKRLKARTNMPKNQGAKD